MHTRKRPVAYAVVSLFALALGGCDQVLGYLFVAGYGVSTIPAREREREARFAPCHVRACPANQHCNHNYEPPRCAPTIGQAGMPCGLSRVNNQDYFQCGTGLTCEGPVEGPKFCR